MCSNPSWRIIASACLSALIAMAATGCGLNLGEKAPKPAAPSFSGKGYSCVGEIPEHFDKYFKDEMSETEISEFVRCLQNAFTSFGQLTRGRDQSVYSPGEIRNFLQSYFLKDRPISNELLHQFMLIKQALIGGSLENISRSELYTAIEVLEDMKTEAIRLKPHIKVLNGALAKKQDPHNLGQRLNEAGQALSQTINVFAARLHQSQQVYRFVDLQSFLTEFRTFVEWDQHFPDALPVASWIAMLKNFKAIAIGPQVPEGISATEWNVLLPAMANWYLAFLQYDIGVKGQPVLQGVGLQNMRYLAQEIFKLSEDAINNQATGQITFDQMLALAQAMQDLKWLPANLRMCGLRTALQSLVSKMFGAPGTPPDLRIIDTGLRVSALSRMKADFFRWADAQALLDGQYKSVRPPASVIPKLEGLPSIVQPEARVLLDQPRGASWADLMRLKALMKRPLFPEEIDRVYLVGEADFPRYNMRNEFFNLSAMNIVRSLVTMVFRGYARDGIASDGYLTGIRSAEMQKFYEDFRDIGIDFGLIDKRNSTAGARAFVEGNLFTYSANGLKVEPDPELDANGKPIQDAEDKRTTDERLASELTFVEAMEYFSFLYSGGQSANDLYADLVAHGCEMSRLGHKAPLDINGQRKLARSCVENTLPGFIDRHLSNMPGLQAYLHQVPKDAVLDYTRNVLRTAYTESSDINWVEYSELTTVTVIMSYAEAVMTRYDANRDGSLDTEELYPAEDVFSGFIQVFAKERLGVDLSEAQAKGAFRYILYYREMPSGTWGDYWSINSLAWYGPTLSLDRGQLAQVFRLILSKLFEAKSAPVASPTCHN